MTVYRIVPATNEHGIELADNMRQPDIEEVWASAHMAPRAALDYSLRISTEAYVGLADDKVVGMFGAVKNSILSDSATVWFLSSKELSRHKRKFLAVSREVISSWRLKFSPMTCYVDPNYTAAIRWVNWMGFTFVAAIPHGPDNKLFYLFKMGE